jgi:hypothetical protein
VKRARAVVAPRTSSTRFGGLRSSALDGMRCAPVSNTCTNTPTQHGTAFDRFQRLFSLLVQISLDISFSSSFVCFLASVCFFLFLFFLCAHAYNGRTRPFSFLHLWEAASGHFKERRYGLTAMWRAHWDLLALSNVALDDGCAISSLSMACHS